VHQFFLKREAMQRIEGATRKWVALAAVVALAGVAWFTMDGVAGEQARIAWFTVDAPKIRLAVVLIILSFGLRILLMDRLAGKRDDENDK
jgi:hypothetical protein